MHKIDNLFTNIDFFSSGGAHFATFDISPRPLHLPLSGNTDTTEVVFAALFWREYPTIRLYEEASLQQMIFGKVFRIYGCLVESGTETPAKKEVSGLSADLFYNLV
jgi:hypothetical protein